MSSFQDTNASCPDGYRALSAGELRELLQNDDKMDQIVRVSEKVRDMQVDRETLLATNRSLAEESLAQRPRLNNGKLQLAHKYRELSNLATACWEKQSRLEGRSQQQGLQTAQNLLQEEVQREEAQSEELLEKFMEGNVPLEDFLDAFQSSRRAYHVRRAQVEKIHEASRAGRAPPEPKKPPEEPQRQQQEQEEKKRSAEQLQEPPQRPNGFAAPPQGPPRIFQLRYGLTPAILLPHFPLSPPASAPGAQHHHHHHHHSSIPPPESQLGQTHILSPSSVSAHGQPVGLRVIGQLQGGWPPGGRPVRLQQLYRPSPQQPEPPYR